MKKILLLFSICLISMLGYAQTNEDGKESVYIDYFSRPGSINNILAEALRNKIIEGIQLVQVLPFQAVDGRFLFQNIGVCVNFGNVFNARVIVGETEIF